MPMIKWDQKMSIGSEVVDQDHRDLLDIIGEFSPNIDHDKATNIAKRLLAYTVVHFFHEEELWDRIAYKNAASHKIAHAKIISALMRVVRALEGKYQPGMLDPMFELKRLTEGFVRHLLQTDSDMRVESPETELQHEQEKAYDYSSLKVLVYESSRDTMAQAIGILGAMGVRRVFRTSDGSTGLVMFLREKPSVLLCDLGSVNDGGIAFASMLRDYEISRAQSFTPMIFAVAPNEQIRAHLALNLKISCLIQKPLQAHELRRKINIIADATNVSRIGTA